MANQDKGHQQGSGSKSESHKGQQSQAGHGSKQQGCQHETSSSSQKGRDASHKGKDQR